MVPGFVRSSANESTTTNIHVLLWKLHRYPKQMNMLERDKQARLTADDQKANVAIILKTLRKRIRKEIRLRNLAKALEDEKEEKVRFVV